MRRMFGRRAAPNVGKLTRVTDAERLRDIEDKLLRWRYLAHYREAEGDVRWLVAQLRGRDARIAALEEELHALRSPRVRGRPPRPAGPVPGDRLERSAVSAPGRSVSAGSADAPERPRADTE